MNKKKDGPKSLQNDWNIQMIEKEMPQIKQPLLLVGLPGIGNVGKIAVDFLIDELKAQQLMTIHSSYFPSTVFVTEENLVILPSIELWYKKGAGKTPDILFLSGDVQPTDQHACYGFCNMILDMFEDFGGKQIITAGGIGLQEIPEQPTVFCTGTTKADVEKYVKGTKANPNIYGVVGAFIGVAGVLVGLSGQRNIPAVSLLAETFAHPYYVGVKGSKEILLLLQKKLFLEINLDTLEKEVKAFEKELMQTAEQLEEAQKQTPPSGQPQSYIG